MENLRKALTEANITLPKGFNLKGYVGQMGFDPDSLSAEDIGSLIQDLGSHTQLTSKTSSAIAKGSAKQGIQKDRPATDPTSGQADFREAFQSVSKAQKSVVGGFEDALQDRAVSDHNRMIRAAMGLTPNTIAMVGETLSQASEKGAFNPETFREAGRALIG